MRKFSAKTIISTAVLFIAPIVLLTPTASAVSSSNMANLANQQRQATGLSGYAWNDTLASSAYAKAKDMCTKHYWAHNSPDGLTPWSFIKAAGYDYTNAGENLAADFSTDQGVIKGWMNSPAHKANILHAEYKEIGIASMECNLTGELTTVVVAHFGARNASYAPKQPDKVAVKTEQTTSSTPSPKQSVAKVKPANTKKDTQKPSSNTIPKEKEQPIAPKEATDESFTDVLLSMLFKPREFVNNLY